MNYSTQSPKIMAFSGYLSTILINIIIDGLNRTPSPPPVRLGASRLLDASSGTH
jgi:hypothetical protein